MKKLFFLAASVALVACSENPTQPENLTLKGPNLTVLTPGGNTLLSCFDGTTDSGGAYGGVCTTTADHKKGFLNNSSSVAGGDYSGVYSGDRTVYGQYLTDITALSYHYKNTVTAPGLPALGDLSYNIPIDANADGVFDPTGPSDFWAFVDAANCGLKSEAAVNIVTMAKCGIVDGSPPKHPLPYSNWGAFVADYSGAKVANFDVTNSVLIIIVAERVPPSRPAAKWTISDVSFGKTGLICFDGPKDGPQGGITYGGQCTLGSDFKSATLTNNNHNSVDGDYAGVYSRETTGYGLYLSNVKDLTYKYKGPVPSLDNLRYNIPIDTDADGDYDFYAIVDATNCRGTPNASGVYTVKITTDANCGIVDGSPPGHGSPAVNWAQFVSWYPNAKIANDLANGAYIFVLASFPAGASPTSWAVSELKWGAKK